MPPSSCGGSISTLALAPCRLFGYVIRMQDWSQDFFDTLADLPTTVQTQLVMYHLAECAFADPDFKELLKNFILDVQDEYNPP